MSSMEVDEDVPAQLPDQAAGPSAPAGPSDAAAPLPSPQPALANIATPGGSVMAATGTIGSVSVSLHPLVILNISEHWTRQRAQEGKDMQVVGALIGKQTGRHVEIMNSFELSFDMLDNNIIIDRKYYTLKEEQYKQVFSDLDLLGWYTTGDTPGPGDLLVHQQICDLLESPIFLKLNPMARNTELCVHVYESIVDVTGACGGGGASAAAGSSTASAAAASGVAASAGTLLLVELPYTLATEEAERIGVDHVQRMSHDHNQDSTSIVAENLRSQYLAIKMLASRVKLIAEYVKASQRGEVPHNHEILRQIKALSHRLPVLNSQKFGPEFYNQCSDVALMAYLGSITKCCNTMHRFINRFNLLHERLGMGRRMRGLFF